MPAHARKRRGTADVARAARRAGRGWRRSRPFWGAVIILVAGGETAAVRFPLPLRATWTILPAGLLIVGGMIACGLLLLFDPAQRSRYAVGAILLSITALETSHLGGYLIGTLLGLAGGATAFAWVPRLAPAPPAAPPGFTLILGEADRHQLAGVIPLVGSGGQVHAVIALQANQTAVEAGSEDLGNFGLARARLAFQEQWALHDHRQMYGGRQFQVGDVAVGGVERDAAHGDDAALGEGDVE